MKSYRVATLLLLGFAAALAACSDDGKPCNPDQELRSAACYPKPEAGVPDAGDMPDADDTDSGEEEDASVADTAADPIVDMVKPPAFGRLCTMSGDSAECESPAPYCAVQPGAMMGYCTALGCKSDPSICPTGWMCFEISSINLNFCLKP